MGTCGHSHSKRASKLMCDLSSMSQCATPQVTHAFPAVLEKLDLPAFDMSKIISTFVRHLAPGDQVRPPATAPALVNLAPHPSVTSSAQHAPACWRVHAQ